MTLKRTQGRGEIRMDQDARVDLTFLSGRGPVVDLGAQPQQIRFRLPNFTLVVVDMQNAFAKKGGMFDRNGLLDATKSRRVITTIQAMIATARRLKVKVVYLAHEYDEEHLNAGGLDSPNYWKEIGVASSRLHPEFRKFQFITKGSWDSRIVDELTPTADEIVIKKTRYSGFTNPELGKTLAKSRTKIVGFTGIATNVCVESTLRDAYFAEFFPVLFEDACLQNGPSMTQAATVETVRNCFGWTSTSRQFVQALDDIV